MINEKSGLVNKISNMEKEIKNLKRKEGNSTNELMNRDQYYHISSRQKFTQNQNLTQYQFSTITKQPNYKLGLILRQEMNCLDHLKREIL